MIDNDILHEALAQLKHWAETRDRLEAMLLAGKLNSLGRADKAWLIDAITWTPNTTPERLAEAKEFAAADAANRERISALVIGALGLPE